MTTMSRSSDAPPTSAGRPVALVTGGSRGLGRAIALDLAAQGHDVAVTARSHADAQAAADVIVRAHPSGRAHAVPLEVTDAASVARAVAVVADALGPITVLVNNAGIQRLGGVLEQTEADWNAVIGTNLTGAFLVAQAVARRMVEQGSGGSIVNIASAAGLIPFAGRPAYAAAKAGLIMLTRSFALELAPHRIRVNAVAPTFVETDLGRQTLDQPGVREQITGRIPLGRVASEADVAAAVRYLVSADAGFITGTVLPVDGGIAMR
jgi:3-oxoacyl-[acyl-carrier protein] reductase